ncbi:hypothetical protein QRD43_13540 [Pelomonas sp. APW6]|uniref:Alginate export domain-containing protein n=1 Tax=Roseateles subflavus TaxID=3053353 RepID=A0ABT7LJ88_9BURK|nr:hypothetical protein [Pelomonas sp. APW6]MDL5032933.1 hypothetical protein [Pelomonas sp. APW6]
MSRHFLVMALSMGLGAAQADVLDESSVQWRSQVQSAERSRQGPLAAAEALQPGIDGAPRQTLLLEAEWRARRGPVNATLYAQHLQRDHGAARSHAAVNELYTSGDWGGADGWQYSLGRKLVSWDVGYAFRPNDMVAQEERRTLLGTYSRGRPVLQLERFSAETAWSLVWVNPADAAGQGADEEALALRVYQRAGAWDWHGFARLGREQRASVGAAFSWVASDALELHASARVNERSLVWRLDTHAPIPAAASPWRREAQSGSSQLLLGGTWTTASQLSLLVEYWWDSQAMSRADADAWRDRGTALVQQGLHAPAALHAAIAGNLAWQAQGFASSSLQRHNVFARLSGTHGAWSWAGDVLWAPQDGGRLLTASVAWQGDRWNLQAGLRQWAGPADSMIAQLPTRRLAFAAAALAF